MAGKNDLRLLNLCRPHDPARPLGGPVQECEWIQADGTVKVSQEGQTAFRSLMSELGVVIAPRLQTPADTLGYAGFQFSAELGITKINNTKKLNATSTQSYWDGTEAVDPLNPGASRPDPYLTTVGGFVRKGFLIPFPAFELGAGAVSVLGSGMYALQTYAKLALQEGFHGWAIPSFSVRGSVSQLLGTDQVDLTVWGIDLLISKAFSLGGTARVEPFGGWNILFIDARSGVIDATPTCDAYVAKQTPAGAPAPSPACAPADNGTSKDLNSNFTFPNQDVILRQRWFGGLKLKLSVLFLVAEYDLFLAGHSTDDSQAAKAADISGSQQSFSLSAGFDF
jgi:hypothetical protein